MDEYLSKLIAEAVPTHRSKAAVALLDAWEEEDATEDQGESRRRREQWASFKAAMNEARSSARILFP